MRNKTLFPLFFLFVILLSSCATSTTVSSIPTESLSPTTAPTTTSTHTPTPPATPIPPTPEGAEGLTYNPDNQSLVGPKGTPGYILSEDGQWQAAEQDPNAGIAESIVTATKEEYEAAFVNPGGVEGVATWAEQNGFENFHYDEMEGAYAAEHQGETVYYFPGVDWNGQEDIEKGWFRKTAVIEGGEEYPNLVIFSSLNYLDFEGMDSIVLGSAPAGVEDDSYRQEAIKMYQEYVFGNTGGNLRDVKVLFSNGMSPDNTVYVESGGHFGDYASMTSAGGHAKDVVLSVLFDESITKEKVDEFGYTQEDYRVLVTSIMNDNVALAVAEYWGGEKVVISKLNDHSLREMWELLVSHNDWNGIFEFE